MEVDNTVLNLQFGTTLWGLPLENNEKDISKNKSSDGKLIHITIVRDHNIGH